MMKTFKEIITPRILINSCIAGGLVLFGSFTNGNLTSEGLCFAVAGFGVAFLTQLKQEINIPMNKKGAVKFFQFI